ncbi:FAD-dependent oxidoreductase, partial [Acinetobacter baumannii]
WVEKAELKKVLGTDFYSRAIFTPGSYLMQPAALVRGMGDHLPDNVELLEQSPIRSLQKSNNQWLLQGDHGSITTPKVLLATSI